MAWSWSFFPTRLMRDPRMLRLAEIDSHLLMRLYACCDRWGRGSTEDIAMRVATGLVTCTDLADRVARLATCGLVLVSADGSAWELERYDGDAPRDVKRDRPPSEYPQGKQNGPREKSGELPDPIRDEPGEPPDTPRISPGHFPLMRAPARPKARQGKALERGPKPRSLQPSPSGSTDARAYEPPTSGGEDPRAGGAGSPPAEIPEQEAAGSRDVDPPPKPVPRRVALTREQEAQLVAERRAQVAAMAAAEAAGA